MFPAKTNGRPRLLALPLALDDVPDVFRDLKLLPTPSVRSPGVQTFQGVLLVVVFFQQPGIHSESSGSQLTILMELR